MRSATACHVPLYEGQTLHYAGASVGLVAVPSNTSVDVALQQADTAMYADKQKRRALDMAAQHAA